MVEINYKRSFLSNETFDRNLYSPTIFNLLSSLAKEIIFEKTIRVVLKQFFWRRDVFWRNYALPKESFLATWRLFGKIRRFWPSDAFFWRSVAFLAKWRIREKKFFWRRHAFFGKVTLFWQNYALERESFFATWRFFGEMTH